MVTVTITNASSTAAIGAGQAISLPSIFNWASIAASGNKAYVVRVQDMEGPESRLSGFTVADALQKMVQLGQITLTMANVTDATEVVDVDGLAVHDA